MLHNDFLTMKSKVMKIVAPQSYSLSTSFVKNSNKKNKNSICSELPKFSMLLKKCNLVLYELVYFLILQP